MRSGGGLEFYTCLARHPATPLRLSSTVSEDPQSSTLSFKAALFVAVLPCLTEKRFWGFKSTHPVSETIALKSVPGISGAALAVRPSGYQLMHGTGGCILHTIQNNSKLRDKPDHMLKLGYCNPKDCE